MSQARALVHATLHLGKHSSDCNHKPNSSIDSNRHNTVSANNCQTSASACPHAHTLYADAHAAPMRAHTHAGVGDEVGQEAKEEEEEEGEEEEEEEEEERRLR
eukprot:13149710-Alexandrium_andersonii.AAC.1